MLQLCSTFRPQLLLLPRQFRFSNGILIRQINYGLSSNSVMNLQPVIPCQRGGANRSKPAKPQVKQGSNKTVIEGRISFEYSLEIKSKLNLCKCSAGMAVGEVVEKEDTERSPRFNWPDVGLNLTEEQDEAITRIPINMSKRCQALMRQIICFSSEKGSFCDLLGAWVRRMNPIRADWLSLLKELKNLESPFYIKVAEFSLLEDSFEPNARDYTKIIHYYGKLNQVEDAERTLLSMKNRGFLIDQVTLTAMVQLYSKAGYHKLAEETFTEIKLLGEPLDNRSYGSMIMAYIRAGAPDKGEDLIREMDSQEIFAGREVYKALLRAYSMGGDAEGAKRVFDAVQLAGITPEVKLCGLLINAYSVSGQSQNARLAFENMRKAGIKATDKCVALVLAAYEKEEKLNEALGFLVELEKESILVGKEASAVLARWFKKLGVVEEVELVLREFSSSHSQPLDVGFNSNA